MSTIMSSNFVRYANTDPKYNELSSENPHTPVVENFGIYTQSLTVGTWESTISKFQLRLKQFWEVKAVSGDSIFGIIDTNTNTKNSIETNIVAGNRVIYLSSGNTIDSLNIYSNFICTGSTPFIHVNDVVGFAFDEVNGTLDVYINGISANLRYSDVFLGKFHIMGGLYTVGSSLSFNFGKNGFLYTPPVGFSN